MVGLWPTPHSPGSGISSCSWKAEKHHVFSLVFTSSYHKLYAYFSDISAAVTTCYVITDATHPPISPACSSSSGLSFFYDLCIRFSSSILLSWKLEGYAKIFASVSAAPFSFLTKNHVKGPPQFSSTRVDPDQAKPGNVHDTKVEVA